MRAPKRVLRPRRSARLWCVPPALLRDPGDTLEGERILAEAPDDLAYLLWRTARDVTLWGQTPCSGRGGLFTPQSANARLALLAETELPRELAAPLDTLHAMLSDSSRTDEGAMSVCCLEVAAWARGAGLPHTATAFAQAAALASPEFAEAALHTGLYARAAGQDARAETWLRRAVDLARRERDMAAYSAALVELGSVYERRKQMGRAETYYRWAFRAGRRFSARSARMRAAYGLFRLAWDRGEIETALELALSAQRLYQSGVEGGPSLLLDLALFWKEQGQFQRAHAALRRLLPFWEQLPPAVQLQAASLLARTLATRGLPQRGASAAALAWSLMDTEEIAEHVRFSAAFDLLRAALIKRDRDAFTRAKGAVLRLAPHDEFPAVAAQVRQMWPDDSTEPPALHTSADKESAT